MAKDITLLGASYPAVPAVILPKTGGGTAMFVDTSDDTVTAAKMLQGETAHNAAGEQVTGAIPSQAGTTVVPTRTEQTIVTAGKYTTGAIKVAAIPNTYYTAEEALELFFPVGSVYTSNSGIAPTFGGTWEEIKVTATWTQMKSGEHGYTKGASSGGLHYWLRTA